MQLSLSTAEARPALDTPREKRALIALSLVARVGPSRIRALLARFDAPSDVFRASAQALQQVDGIGPQTAQAIRAFDDRAAVDEQWQQATDLGATLLTPWARDFPARLQQIYDPPAFLWMRGTLTAADERGIAIVGTRRCTDYGRQVAHQLATGLARRGFTIVSGLAYGIDAAAHQAALDVGGRTIAVLGSGIDNIYPPKHTAMARAIAAQGALLSELPLGAAPDASNFPERNRIVSGLTLGTIVVESHAKGGSLITARMATEQNREVFAVPGAVGKSSSVGTNRLIQRGHAKLVLSVDDVIDELALVLPADALPPSAGRASTPDASDTDASATDASTAAPTPDLPPNEQALYDALSTTPVHIDSLCATLDLTPAEALVPLLQLEFKGLVKQLAGKQFRRA
ncbi:DNA-processing protein DprA [Salisaeta longa]|uniref:DNA-processing protein DprA n=1 Tax=Salisaeta longa TaxID=503170 RepID=UPI0003B52AF7|nr:DNA-processing protein DprA [Salisaeta longa]